MSAQRKTEDKRPPVFEITGGFIREACPDDAPTLSTWWADGAVMEHAGFPDGIKTDLDALKERLSSQKPADILWILEDRCHKPVGEMHHRIAGKEAVIGIKICDRSAQGAGLGPAALKRLITHLFESFDIEKIALDTMIENVRAQHVYASLRFKKTRIAKDVWKDQRGRLRTAVEYELDRETFEADSDFFRNGCINRSKS